jgi:hypothetical protein
MSIVNRTPVVMPASVLAQVANLHTLSFKELKQMWLNLFGSAPTVQRRPYLEGRIAYRLQEIAYAQVNPSLLASNQKRIDSMIEHLKPLAKVQRKRDPYKLVPGTRLARDFRGNTHEVTVLSDGGFEYQGRPYTSLTAISQEITGQKWSGPSFFGLTRKNPAVLGGRG